MNETEARQLLGSAIRSDGSLYCLGHYMAWTPERMRNKRNTIYLDDDFTVEELEAIIWWMRNKGPS